MERYRCLFSTQTIEKRGFSQRMRPMVDLISHRIHVCHIWFAIYLVGGWATPLKNMSSSIGMIIPNIWENKKCSKPPTSLPSIYPSHVSINLPLTWIVWVMGHATADQLSPWSSSVILGYGRSQGSRGQLIQIIRRTYPKSHDKIMVNLTLIIW